MDQSRILLYARTRQIEQDRSTHRGAHETRRAVASIDVQRQWQRLAKDGSGQATEVKTGSFVIMPAPRRSRWSVLRERFVPGRCVVRPG
jgi:hypothetical protein